jgi:hypothetical protein
MGTLHESFVVAMYDRLALWVVCPTGVFERRPGLWKSKREYVQDNSNSKRECTFCVLDFV